MRRKSKKPVRKQTHSPTGEVVGQVGQILLPMIAGIAATKADLTEWVYEQGLTALHLLLREDAEKIAGPKGKHEKERTHNHWGSTDGELSFGGRRIQVSRPRVRSKSGAEASLPYFEALPSPSRIVNRPPGRHHPVRPERRRYRARLVRRDVRSARPRMPLGGQVLIFLSNLRTVPRAPVKLLIPPTCLAGEARCEAPRLS